MRSRCSRALTISCIVAVSIGATAPAPHAQTPEAQTDGRAAIQELLDRRAAAVLEGDEAAFMRTVARFSKPFVERQRRLFRGLQTVPLESYELTAAWGRAGDLARSVDRQKYRAADEVLIPMTEERYRLARLDPRPAVDDHFFTYVRLGDEWLIAQDSDLADVGLLSARHLWDAGPVEVQRSGSFVLFGHPCTGPGSEQYGCADVPQDFLRLAEQARSDARRHLSGRFPKRVAIMAPATQEELGRMLQATYELDNFLAFATSTVDVTDGIEYTGHRIALNWNTIGGSSDSYMRTVLAHELVHIATRLVSGPHTPYFVDEGIAEYVGRFGDQGSLDFLESAVSEGTFDRRLPEDHEFTTGGPERIFLNYKESQSAITFMIERWGMRKFMSFYEDLGSRRAEPGVGNFHMNAALKKTFGVNLARFERMWADSIGG